MTRHLKVKSLSTDLSDPLYLLSLITSLHSNNVKFGSKAKEKNKECPGPEFRPSGHPENGTGHKQTTAESQPKAGRMRTSVPKRVHGHCRAGPIKPRQGLSEHLLNLAGGCKALRQRGPSFKDPRPGNGVWPRLTLNRGLGNNCRFG